MTYYIPLAQRYVHIVVEGTKCDTRIEMSIDSGSSGIFWYLPQRASHKCDKTILMGGSDQPGLYHPSHAKHKAAAHVVYRSHRGSCPPRLLSLFFSLLRLPSPRNSGARASFRTMQAQAKQSKQAKLEEVVPRNSQETQTSNAASQSKGRVGGMADWMTAAGVGPSCSSSSFTSL